MNGQVVPFRLSRARALALVRQASKETGRIVLTRHAQQRMRQRRITMKQILACLGSGIMTEGPALDVRGCWACRMERTVLDDAIKVGLAIDPAANVIIVTVI